MKRYLITFAAVGALALGGLALAQNENEPGQADHAKHAGRGWHGRHGGPLEHMTETLNLTPDQKAKVQPILDQARPQIVAIHQEAMQKTKAVMETTMSQVRPLLTPEQQQKLDEMKKAHEEMRDAAKKFHDAKKS
jgi:Spy/CpxP family protein refolding chaperone